MFDLLRLRLKGRAERSEWWVINIFAGTVAEVAWLFGILSGVEGNWLMAAGCFAVGLVAIWAAIAVTARRFRTRGESAWMTLLLLVPLLGVAWVVIACGILPSSTEPRRKVVTRRISR